MRGRQGGTGGGNRRNCATVATRAVARCRDVSGNRMVMPGPHARAIVCAVPELSRFHGIVIRMFHRDHIAPIVTVGVAYRLTYFTVITMPGTRSRDYLFIEECLWVLTAAEHHGDELERLGIGASSREALRAAIHELRDSIAGTQSARIMGVGTGIGIRTMLRQAWALLRAVSRMVDAEPNLSAVESDEWRAAILHAPRPAHRLAAARRLPAQLALPAGPEAQAVGTSAPPVAAEPTPPPVGSSLVVRARTDIAPAVGRTPPRPFARIIARVRLLLPLTSAAAREA